MDILNVILSIIASLLAIVTSVIAIYLTRREWKERQKLKEETHREMPMNRPIN